MWFTTYSPSFSASCLLWLMSNTRVRLECISEGVLRHVSLASFHLRGLKSCSEKRILWHFLWEWKERKMKQGVQCLKNPWEAAYCHVRASVDCFHLVVTRWLSSYSVPSPSSTPQCAGTGHGARLKEAGLWTLCSRGRRSKLCSEKPLHHGLGL